MSIPAAAFGDAAPGGKSWFKYIRVPEDGGSTAADKEGALTFKALRPVRVWLAVLDSSPVPAWLSLRFAKTPHVLSLSNGSSLAAYRAKTLAIPPRYASARLEPTTASLTHLDAPPSTSAPDASVVVKVPGLGVRGAKNYVIILEEVPLCELSVAECKAVLRIGEPEPAGAALPLPVSVGWEEGVADSPHPSLSVRVASL